MIGKVGKFFRNVFGKTGSNPGELKWDDFKGSFTEIESSKFNGVLQVAGRNKIKLPLSHKYQLSHDTFIFRFSLADPTSLLGLPIGQHVSISGTFPTGEKPEGEYVSRNYTPVSRIDDRGFVDLLIKVYFKDVIPKFPHGGKMSQHINDLNIGDTLDFQGPKGKLIYNGNNEFLIKKGSTYNSRKIKNVGMIAGGTGVTPMFQVIEAIANDDSDNTHVSLLYANKAEEDILLRHELESYEHENKIHLSYTLDEAPKDKEWEHYTGFVSKEMIQARMPPPAEDSLILMCGPPPMIKFCILPILEELGYSDNMFFKF
eukprot:CAMPEP_0115011156 /NCGR_PEP_ID=MMETSP0216-20121206/23803_1 /TAXON_ID=223996 /ORGANISM="Protocruzia adherens, Strain Boccale" /LENGTH=314 /DNA_ID=CAMNT_0002379627 /DNA_START=68 /DNA_END=1012 /DNA_ORIENTATION=+